MMRFFFIFMTFVALSGPAMARDMSAFEKIPVLHEGRIKPMDSFARAELKRFAGHDKGASQWLAQVLFDPARAVSEPVLAVKDSSLVAMLGLPPGEKLYSAGAVTQGLSAHQEELESLSQEDPKKLTASQRALLTLNDNAMHYAFLLGSLTMVLPVEGQDGATYLDLQKQQEDITAKVKDIVKTKGDNPEDYSEEEQALAFLGMKIDFLAASGTGSTMLRIIPPQWGADSEWLSPWASIHLGQGSPQGAAYLQKWKAMADAWRSGDEKSWGAASRETLGFIKEQTDGKGVAFCKLAMEHIYSMLQPFMLAQILYILAFVVLVLAAWKPHQFLPRIAMSAAFTGALLHTAGIILRIYILDRPPVGTLYESILFVSLIALIPALYVGLLKGNKPVALGGLGVAAGILSIAPFFAPAGDSMEMLVAVLNTGFWLATHVICITAGYGVSILAAVLAHIALVRRDLNLTGLIQKTLIAALFLTAFGTMLGGIWADQSWGRFWGWDPKENGALLIVLWLAWIMHGRMAGFLKGRTWLAAAAGLNIAVALSWFGVNLLNVGLHSYGFISGVATGLVLFCSAEILFIAVTMWKGKTHAH